MMYQSIQAQVRPVPSAFSQFITRLQEEVKQIATVIDCSWNAEKYRDRSAKLAVRARSAVGRNPPRHQNVLF